MIESGVPVRRTQEAAAARFPVALKPINRIALPLIVAVLFVGLVVTASFWSFRETAMAVEARKHGYDLTMRADEFLSELKDAETGQRGYLLTGDEVFLAPYLTTRMDIRRHFDELKALTHIESAHQHLETIGPLLDAKLAEMEAAVQLRRNHHAAAATAAISSGRGKRLMDRIRVEVGAYIGIESDMLTQRDAELHASLNQLFVTIVIASLLTLVFVCVFAWLIYREKRHGVQREDLLETRRLLDQQEEMNKQLHWANTTLQVSEAKTAVTLNSIGDAVIVTDGKGHVTLLNPVAEQLTGWKQAEASGLPVNDIFRILNQETRQPSVVPVAETLEQGTIKGLANHTVLIARDGSECAIADSCAPIRDADGQVVGAVLVFRDVTDEYVVQQALRDSAALVKTILNTVDDGVITLRADDSTIEIVNPATERLFGYAMSELVGADFSVLIPELGLDRGKHSLEYYRATDAESAAGLGREVVGRRKDGSTFALEIAVSEMNLGGQRFFTGVLRDITMRKLAEERLRKAGALQNAIYNSANFSSIATDAMGVIQIFNVGAERMLGYSAAEVMNRITPADISEPEEVIMRAEQLSVEFETQILPGFEALVFKASRGIEDIYELTYIRKDGSRIPALVSVTALKDEGGDIIGYLLIGTNNSVRKRIESERNEALAAAEKANLAKTDFLSSMSHELRTPLNAILGFTQLMESGTPAPTPAQKRNLDHILKAGWYLLELINEILDLALIESGKVTMSHEPVALVEVMLECRAMVEPQAGKRGIGMTFPSFDLPYFVNADRTRVKQVLVNLLFNAVKYNRPGGTVDVGFDLSPPGSIRISVSDTGNGLNESQLAQLFQPFNRLGKESGAEEGTGIGLVVTKRLVELMGGVIGVDSTVGVGSVFWFELNLTTAPQLVTLEVEYKTAEKIWVADGMPQRTLLYVEDNPANLELVDQLIARRQDLRLLSTADGTLGVEFARAYLPEVILMDINLPGISGIDALHILKMNPATAHIPVIALSANAVPRDIEKGLEAGFFRYLTKPIKVGEFMDTLDVALKFSEANADHRPARETT